MLETFRINVIKDYLFNQLLFMHCSNKIVQYNKLVCNFYISQLLKKGGRRYDMQFFERYKSATNILSSDLCICFKTIFLICICFSSVCCFYCKIFFIQDDFFNFCKTLMYPSPYIIKKKTQSK